MSGIFFVGIVALVAGFMLGVIVARRYGSAVADAEAVAQRARALAAQLGTDAERNATKLEEWVLAELRRVRAL